MDDVKNQAFLGRSEYVRSLRVFYLRVFFSDAGDISATNFEILDKLLVGFILCLLLVLKASLM